MKKLNFKRLKAENFLCFGTDGIELNLDTFGNIVLITGRNLDTAMPDGTPGNNGIGKCFGKGTSILMFNGTVKRVEDINVGDLVMGNDSTPRKVISTARGREMMYKIAPSKGKPYIVNESHVLALKRASKKPANSMPDYMNISVRKYLSASSTIRHLMRGYRVPVEWPEEKVRIDPYFLGCWLGDGSSNDPHITTQDAPIEDVVYNEASDRGLLVKVWKSKKKTCPTYSITNARRKGTSNTLRDDLKYYSLLGNKHVPLSYKVNSRKVRLQLLAGFLDKDGSASSKCYDYTIKSKQLAHDIAFVARSLGFCVTLKKCRKRCQTGVVGTYWRGCISGDCSIIPVKLRHKKIAKRLINKNCLVNGIRVKPIGQGDYYGFSVDGNHLFLLDDFTVVHNSSIQEILVYGLYGKTIKRQGKFNHKDVINNQIGKKLLVEVEWDDFKVIRTRKPDSLLLYKNGVDITKGAGMPAVQKLIEEQLGLSYETFINVVVFSDDNANCFLECDAEAKRKIVENLLGLEKYVHYHENAKAVVKVRKKQIEVLTSEYQAAVQAKKDAEERLSKSMVEEKLWKVRQQEELEKIVETISRKKKQLIHSDAGAALMKWQDAQNTLQDLTKELPSLEEREKQLKSIISKIRAKLDDTKTKRHELRLAQQTCTNALDAHSKEIARHKKVIADLDGKKGIQCPYCYGVVDESNYRHVVLEAQENIAQQHNEITKQQIAQKDILGKIAATDTAIETIAGMLSETEEKAREQTQVIQEANLKIHKCREVHEPKAGTDELLLKQEIDLLVKQVEQKRIEAGMSPFAEIIAQSHKEAGLKDKESIAKKEELKLAEEDLPYYEFWVRGFGDNGIRTFIIDGIIPALNNRVAYWLQYLIDSKITLKLDNKLEETIERNPPDGDPFVYYVMSMGERRRLNLSVSQAFGQILTLNSGANPNILFLDEVSTNIDSIGIQGVYRMICQLAQDKKVFVTTHDQGLLALLQGCQQIQLVKHKGFTKLIADNSR